MKTKFPKSFVLLIAAIVIIVALFVTASAKNNELSSQSVSDVSSEYDVSSNDELPMSGYCGENIKWELDENGVLRLEGSGDMYDFNENNYCYGYYPADPSSSTTRSETTTVPYSYYPTTRPYTENTTYYPATTAPYSQEYTTNPYSYETTYHYGTTTAPQYSTTTNYYQDPTSGYPESTTVYYGTTTAPTTTARQETTTYPQSSTTTYYQEPTSGYPESTTVYYGTTTEPRTTAPTTTQPATTYYPTTTSPYYPDPEPTTSYYGEGWEYGIIYRWNLNFDEIKEVIIGEGITSVGSFAFANCTNLKSVTLPSTLTSVKRYAFSNCTNLKTVTLPNTLTSINAYAFNMCISLEEISVPDSVETIGEEAFYGCLNLKKITLGSGIKSIGYGVFEETGYYINEENWVDSVLYIDNCLIKAKESISGEYSVKDGTIVLADNAFGYCMLTSVTMPDSVINIGNYTFMECHNLSKINIPEGITNIGYCVFYSCGSLSEITIPDSVTSIVDYAFYGCYNLTDLTVPNSLISIGYSSFRGCDGLTTISIPESVTKIGNDAFGDCDSLLRISVDENNQYYSSDEFGALFNKNKTELIQYPIGNEREEYIIPDGVTIIGESAFDCCHSLTTVTIPDSVTNISDHAFYYCYNLSSVTIPDSVTRIGSYAFCYCYNLDIDKLPSVLKTIGMYAFYNCQKITCGNIPDGATKIEKNAFENCNSITNVSIPSSITYIGDDAFSNCDSLESIEVNENNSYYSSDEFGVLFNKDKTVLIQYPIGNTETEYTIPDSVMNINYCAFNNCSKLKNITVGSNNQLFSSDEDGVLFNKDKTELIQYPIGNEREEYTIPSGVTNIGSYAFYGCRQLTSVTIPDGVTEIGYYTFYNCYGISISVPNTVRRIGWFAIGGDDYFFGSSEPKPIERTIYYYGSPSMWEDVYGLDNPISSAKIIFLEEDSPEQPATIVDEGTNVSVDYDAGKIEGEVGLSVEQTFDGKAFDIISTELEINDNVIYDIKMTVDGVETQPSGTVTVRIPLPEGYDPSKTFVYHVNTQIGTVERMNAVYEDGYLVFETDHFSYYAVVEIKDDEPVEQRFKVTWNSNGVVAENKYKEGERITVPQNPTKEGYVFVGWTPSVPEFMPAYDLTFTAVFEAVVPPTDPHFEIGIVKPSTSSVDYGDSIILHAQIDGALPEGAYIVWSESNGNFDMSVSDDGLTCKVSPRANGKTAFTITAYDKDGKVISSGTQIMTANAGLWQRIVAFFKNIFGLTKTIPQIFKGVF